MRASVIYQIRVQGHLARRGAAWFPELTIVNEPNGEATLTGPIRDQAHLHGVLTAVRDFGLPLLSVQRTAPAAPARPAEPGGTAMPVDLTALRAAIRGTVLAPADAGYAAAGSAWNRSFAHHPAVIVEAQDDADVAAAVRFAAQAGLSVAVQATGHGVTRPADEAALLILTARLNRVRVNAVARTAWVEAGATWGAVLAEAQAKGLAPLLGASPTVGAVGYTLGGGLGWLARRYGPASDSVLAFEVVTADGRQLRVSAAEHSELFWGLRGGGGSLAVVVGMEIRLYPVTTVYGGSLVYPAALAGEVLRRFRDWAATAPDELTASVALMNLPPLPDVPEFLRGQSVVMVRGCYCGPLEAGAQLFEPWRSWRAPLADLCGPLPFAEVGRISNDPQDPLPVLTSGAWLNGLSDAVIAALTAHTFPAAGRPPLLLAEVRLAGGAIARLDPAGSAFSRRTAPYLLSLVAVTPAPEVQRSAAEAVAALKDALRPALDGVYLNFLEGEEAQAQIAEAYPAESLVRLMALKARYDPANRLSHSAAVPPRRAAV